MSLPAVTKGLWGWGCSEVADSFLRQREGQRREGCADPGELLPREPKFAAQALLGTEGDTPLRRRPPLGARSPVEPLGLQAWRFAQSSALWHRLSPDGLITTATGASQQARRGARSTVRAGCCLPGTEFLEGQPAVPGGSGHQGLPSRLLSPPGPLSVFLHSPPAVSL